MLVDAISAAFRSSVPSTFVPSFVLYNVLYNAHWQAEVCEMVYGAFRYV